MNSSIDLYNILRVKQSSRVPKKGEETGKIQPIAFPLPLSSRQPKANRVLNAQVLDTKGPYGVKPLPRRGLLALWSSDVVGYPLLALGVVGCLSLALGVVGWMLAVKKIWRLYFLFYFPLFYPLFSILLFFFFIFSYFLNKKKEK